MKTYRVVKTSMGGTRRPVWTGLSYTEAVGLCEFYGWELDEGYVWDLEIEEE